MDIRFDNRIIVVIGGSTGIGKATVKQFAGSGGHVVFTGIEESDDIDISQYHEEGDAVPSYKQLDNTVENDVEEFAAYVDRKYGGCDVLFNNAGILAANILHETPTEEWLKTMNVNVNGMYYTSKYFIPQMLKKGRGAIVNTSSMSGLQADHNFSSYNASKGAVANLTRNMALDYAPYNIRVNAVAPGATKTPMHDLYVDAVGGEDVMALGNSMVYPLKRVGLPEEIANAVLFLASDQASFITGINLVVDGGITAHTGAQNDWELVYSLHAKSKEKQV
ncbi:MAG: SDR family oxidoreductase [Proteobacteria bacterium]|nr:SDR family oxidoreductase [Pseudomonadota bacterium]